MTMNPLPPQAYTKDTLAHAFAWLQTQSDDIRELASNPDMLVGLYLKAKLQGDEALERPSIKNFKHELKSLAGMMGEFSSAARPVETRASARQDAPKYDAPKYEPRSESASSAPAPQPARPSKTQHHQLDPKSVQMIHEVKTQFNLSSEAEALRLMISVGYQRMKGLL
jgi:hypothetical protein